MLNNIYEIVVSFLSTDLLIAQQDTLKGKWWKNSAAMLKVYPLLVNCDLRPSVKDETMTQSYPYIEISIEKEQSHL